MLENNYAALMQLCFLVNEQNNIVIAKRRATYALEHYRSIKRDLEVYTPINGKLRSPKWHDNPEGLNKKIEEARLLVLKQTGILLDLVSKNRPLINKLILENQCTLQHGMEHFISGIIVLSSSSKDDRYIDTDGIKKFALEWEAHSALEDILKEDQEK